MRKFLKILMWIVVAIVGLLALAAFWPIPHEWVMIGLAAIAVVLIGQAADRYNARLENRHAQVMESLRRIERQIGADQPRF